MAVAVSIGIIAVLTLQQQQQQTQEQLHQQQLQAAIAAGQAELGSYTCEQLFNYIAKSQRLGSMDEAQQIKLAHSQDMYLTRCLSTISH
jgi:hypothetical protein